jgi:hypothetical protein
MTLCEYFRKKLFLHKKDVETIELKDTDLLNMFKEEIAEELGVKDLEKDN